MSAYLLICSVGLSLEYLRVSAYLLICSVGLSAEYLSLSAYLLTCSIGLSLEYPTVSAYLPCKQNPSKESVFHLFVYGCVLKKIVFNLFSFCVGTLLRKLEGGLRGVSHVIVDEIHERDINVSVATCVCRRVRFRYALRKC